jgi:hypothetical protein
MTCLPNAGFDVSRGRYLMNPHRESQFDVVPAVFGSLVTVTHGYLNARWFSTHGTHLTRSWLSDPRCIAGAALYASGFCMLVYHDHVLRTLRTPGGPRYLIPDGECDACMMGITVLVAALVPSTHPKTHNQHKRSISMGVGGAETARWTG